MNTLRKVHHECPQVTLLFKIHRAIQRALEGTYGDLLTPGGRGFLWLSTFAHYPAKPSLQACLPASSQSQL